MKHGRGIGLTVVKNADDPPFETLQTGYQRMVIELNRAARVEHEKFSYHLCPPLNCARSPASVLRFEREMVRGVQNADRVSLRAHDNRLRGGSAGKKVHPSQVVAVRDPGSREHHFSRGQLFEGKFSRD